MALPVGFYGSLQWIGWLSLLDEVALNHWNTQLIHFLLKGYTEIIAFIAVNSINSVCLMGHYQPKEPESLKRFKRFKD